MNFKKINFIILIFSCIYTIESSTKLKNLNHAYELMQEYGMEECETKYRSELCLLASILHREQSSPKQEFTPQLAVKQSIQI